MATEPDNFEEDLFADLYAEDESAAKPAPQHAEAQVEPAAKVDAKAEEPYHNQDQTGGDDQEYKDDQDMDDEIDFNLGNGNSHDVSHHHEAHGPGIKEDG